MKLTLAAILDIHTALSDLNGFAKVVKEQVVVVPFSFTSELRKKIAQNRRALKPFVDDYQEERLALIKEVADDGTAHVDENDRVKQSAFAVKDRAVRKMLHNVEGLKMLGYDELLMDGKNPIPSTALDDLAPVITGALPENTAAKVVAPEGGDAEV